MKSVWPKSGELRVFKSDNGSRWTSNQQDKLLADTMTDDVLWSLTDHLGTVRDILGTASTHLIYDAFGNLTSGTNPLLFGFTGKAFDTDTNLQNNINRWYDATVGRWLSTDPIGFEGSDTNLYRYVKNMLVVNVDYWGLKEDAPMCNFLIFIGDNAYMWSLMRKNGLLSPPKPNKEFFGEYPDPQSKDWSIPEGTFVDGYFCWAGDFFENLPNRKNVLIRDWESMPQWGVGDIYNGMVPYLGIADYIRVILPMAEEKANTLRVNRCCNEISVKFKCSRDAKSEIKKQINRLKKELDILIQKQAKNIPQEEKFSIFCESLTILASLSQWLDASQLCDGKEIVL
ncbi:MAG: RHS repeat-associated core domain-containing protein [Thermoguttaceae bacterium]|nr:RHS repeat-associated core domain-containing protein [Thermoguttaceae bacterium]